MRCLLIDASGRADGHTAAVCGAVSRRLRDAGWEVSPVKVPSEGIGLCRGCGACASSGCPITDPITGIIAGMSGADAVVFASPVRFSGPSSQMKALADRMNVLWYRNVPRTVKAYGILVGGSPEPCFAHALSELRALQKGTGMEWGGHIEIAGTDGMAASDHTAAADSLAERIMGSCSRTSSRTLSRRCRSGRTGTGYQFPGSAKRPPG